MPVDKVDINQFAWAETSVTLLSIHLPMPSPSLDLAILVKAVYHYFKDYSRCRWFWTGLSSGVWLNCSSRCLLSAISVLLSLCYLAEKLIYHFFILSPPFLYLFMPHFCSSLWTLQQNIRITLVYRYCFVCACAGSC